MNLTVRTSPSEGSSVYFEGVESCDRKPLECSSGKAENDIFFDPFDVILSVGNASSPNTILDDIEPLHENPLASLMWLDVSTFSSERGMVPAPSEATVEDDSAGWLLNPNFEPLSHLSGKGVDSIEARSSDVSCPSSDPKKENKVSAGNGWGSIVSYCQDEEAHDSCTRMRSDASPSRVQTHRRIWGIGSTTYQQNEGRTRVDHGKSFKPDRLCSNKSTQRRLTSFSSNKVPPEEIESSGHMEGFMHDGFCISKQILGTAALAYKASCTGVAFSGVQGRSDHECTLLGHRDSDNSDGMEEDSLLDDHNGKVNRCRKKAMSRNLMSERRRRSRLNDRLYALRALVPIISKMDKASVLADASSYVRELKRQVNDLQLEVSHLVVKKEALSNDAVMHSSPLLTRSVVSDQQQHRIVQLSVTQMGGEMYHLQLHCKRSRGVLLRLTQAIEALEFRILSANFSASNDNILNTLVIKASKEEHQRSEDVHSKMMEVLKRFGFSDSSEERDVGG